MANPLLHFERFDIVKVLFDRTDQKGDNFTMNLTKTTRVNKEDKNRFFSELLVELKESGTNTNIQVLAYGTFRMEGDNIPDVVYENFAEISAPSIVFPYIRAFIANLTMQSGMNPITLPPLNFAAVLQDQKQKAAQLKEQQVVIGSTKSKD
jgi:preprotein translocase subunit SecB